MSTYETSTYELPNSWESAGRRLGLLEMQLDPMTRRRLARLGVGAGWNCLEVGGGRGSVARWFCNRVGASGSVTATDIDVRFLEQIEEPRLVVLNHDILADELPADRFDLAHARWMLHHLPQPERAIARMVSALKPGGRIVVEEPDIFPVHASTSELYVDFMAALTKILLGPSGRGARWARSLPSVLARQGLVELGAEGDFAVFNGGSPTAQMFRLTAEQLRGKIIQSGALDAQRFEAAMRLLCDPEFWAFGAASIAVWGRKPADASAPARMIH